MLKQYFWPVVVGVLLVFIASYFGANHGLFERGLHISFLFHFTGGVIAAWLVMIFYGRDLDNFSFIKKALIILGGACLIGLAWEWLEFVVGEVSLAYWPEFYPYYHIGTLTDTLGDFLADLLGALLIVFVRR